MALNFPNTPTNAQSYVDPNGHIWVYETATNSWTAQGAPVAGMVYKGPIDVTTAPPTGATTGSLFTVSTGGTPNAGFVGLPTNVPVGSQVIFDGAKWQLMSTTQPDATETVKGIVELATAAETTTGTDATRAVHPAGLKVELDKKAPLDSPALIGVPTAPTAAAGTNTTQLATTAFVHAATPTATASVAGVDVKLWKKTGTTLETETAGDVVSISAGTAALPGLTPVGDPNTGIYSPGADQLGLSTGGIQRVQLESDGAVSFYLGGQPHSRINGNVIYDPNGLVGIAFGGDGVLPVGGTGTPADNTKDLGNSAFRWRTLHAGTGAISTSDANLKQDIKDLDQAEHSVARAISGLVKKFRFIDAVANKGGDARIHVGVIAQEVEQAFLGEGLDPRRYGLFCEDTLENGSKRLAIRYDELLAFTTAAGFAHIEQLETRIATLEARP